MSKPTEKQIKRLKDCGSDDEGFHSVFDDILEERLMDLDKEWMLAMQDIYRRSGNARWCA